jgi:hypothetical protein
MRADARNTLSDCLQIGAKEGVKEWQKKLGTDKKRVTNILCFVTR